MVPAAMAGSRTAAAVGCSAGAGTVGCHNRCPAPPPPLSNAPASMKSWSTPAASASAAACSGRKGRGVGRGDGGWTALAHAARGKRGKAAAPLAGLPASGWLRCARFGARQCCHSQSGRTQTTARWGGQGGGGPSSAALPCLSGGWPLTVPGVAEVSRDEVAIRVLQAGGSEMG